MSDSDYPEYSEDAELGHRGRRQVEDIVRDDLRWIFREIPKDDLGIYGYVEIQVYKRDLPQASNATPKQVD